MSGLMGRPALDPRPKIRKLVSVLQTMEETQPPEIFGGRERSTYDEDKAILCQAQVTCGHARALTIFENTSGPCGEWHVCVVAA